MGEMRLEMQWLGGRWGGLVMGGTVHEPWRARNTRGVFASSSDMIATCDTEERWL